MTSHPCLEDQSLILGVLPVLLYGCEQCMTFESCIIKKDTLKMRLSVIT